jgi:CRP/FNR family transcriptional regulator, cyclic AMP receptor protein
LPSPILAELDSATVIRKNAKIELIRRIPLFSDCSKRELEQIAAIANESEFPAGKTLIKEGDLGWDCYVLVEGEVEITRNGRHVDIQGGSELFGELALLADQPRAATVTTLTPARALVLSAGEFQDLVRKVPSIALKVLKSLAERQHPYPEAQALERLTYLHDRGAITDAEFQAAKARVLEDQSVARR